MTIRDILEKLQSELSTPFLDVDRYATIEDVDVMYNAATTVLRSAMMEIARHDDVPVERAPGHTRAGAAQTHAVRERVAADGVPLSER